jgi:hypothetical protein
MVNLLTFAVQAYMQRSTQFLIPSLPPLHFAAGALHLWEQQQDSSQSVNGGVDGAEVTSNTSAAQHSQSQPGHTTWVPRHSLGGHWDSVAQVGWGIDGGVIGSVSLDQTARLWAATAPSGLPSESGGSHWMAADQAVASLSLRHNSMCQKL